MGRSDRWTRQSGHSRPVPAFWLAGLYLLMAGCGGSSAADVQQPPPPAADFSLTLSSNTVSVSQGGTSSAVAVGVAPQNGFSGQVQISLSALPAGVTESPAAPFTVSAAASASLLFAANASANAGSTNLTLTATSGNLTHNYALALTVQTGAAASIPRNNFVHTNSIATLDNPTGEPHHRHLALDVAHQYLFVANRARNAVEVISTQSAAKLAEIVAPGASSADISSDGKTLWVGSTTQAIYEMDTSTLQVRTSHVLAGLAPLPETVFDRPEEALAMAGGKLLVRMRQPATAQSLLALWDPAANTLTNLTSLAPQVFQNGLGPMAKSADGSRLFAAAADSSGEVALFDSNGALIAGPQTIGGGSTSFAAANKTGTRFAIIFSGGEGAQIQLFDQTLDPLGNYTAANPTGLVFSQDGSVLYVSEQFGGSFVVSSLDANNLHFMARVPDTAIAGIPTQLEESDSTKLLFGLSNRGVSFVDAAITTSLSQNAPVFSAAPVAQPSSGPNSGNTSTILTGANFTVPAAIEFGSQSGAVQSAGSTQLQVTSPANASSGPVNVFAFFQNSWMAIAPDAFSYGPQILEALPNAGSKNGGETIAIYGYGFGTDPAKLTIKIGGASAAVQKIEQIDMFGPSLGLDAAFPFPLQRITLQTPSGAPGYADIALNSPDGSATLSRGFSYLQSEQIFSKPGLYKFLLYDQKRKHLYLSNIDHVDVFDLASAQFLAPIQPPGGPPPNAGLRGLALTPDGSRLVVADFGAQSVYLINPDNSSGSASFVGGIAGYANSGPSRVAATSAQTIFVGMSAEGGSQSGCTACLAQMNVSTFPPTVAPATQQEISFLTGSPLLQATAAGDQVFFSFASAPGGPVAVWNSSSPGQFETWNAHSSTIDLAVSADGAAIAARENSQTSIRDENLNLLSAIATGELERVPTRTEVPGAAMHPSGALLYVPFLTGPAPDLPPAKNVTGGVDILDAHSGALRRRIFLPEPLAMLSADVDGQHGSFLAIDETGQRIFALTNSGLTVLQLASVPLGIGSLTPSNGPASGGTTVTLRGSGFQSATKLTLAGKNIAINIKDASTLTFTAPALSSGTQQLILSNPDGESVSLDAAFTAN
ncbi:MAG: IPT/TIG domain-containing protein [Acidobacteria bacterium]|nr:IPT/TIG domain-containing protein [Acidobacteriota bacterium]MBS1865822.1 IPT/TIG domain-containing protein [Acidobacteriota bacterium]